MQLSHRPGEPVATQQMQMQQDTAVPVQQDTWIDLLLVHDKSAGNTCNDGKTRSASLMTNEFLMLLPTLCSCQHSASVTVIRL